MIGVTKVIGNVTNSILRINFYDFLFAFHRNYASIFTNIASYL